MVLKDDQIALVLPDLSSEDERLDAQSELIESGLPSVLEINNSGPIAGIEEYLPTIVFLFIGREMFSGFFEEMGADAYRSFKTLAKKQCKRWLKAPKYSWIGTKGKLNSESMRSGAYSIMMDCGPELKLKFTFHENQNDNYYECAIDSIDDALHVLLTALEQKRPLPIRYKQLVFEFDPIKKWQIVDFDERQPGSGQ